MEGCKNKLINLEDFILKQNDKESALISVLHYAQNQFGYINKDVQRFIAEKLEIPESKVYGVVSFYSYFTTEPKGKNIINVCTGTACFVRGAGDILNEFKKELNIHEGETTKDNLFTLDTLRCIGACGLAPVVTINNKIYGKVKPEDIKSMLKEYRE
ncbi:NADH-quinone oxidoreductase subunit NuoE [Clostridium senegalense]|uniref:NADH-quinone oxidoreductase subunit NuoE n=1 Tax=Clostridium senegalense TaxID=1465809 RepID=A0A6M0GZT0_9CLOT|nr:NADH-quinone oxidoreductase subunit NuoE [Clostridium senegalense]NEU04116.1 NADH-quinone oxidoreductase subunit NuoE [Clostridium senegalense]